AHLRGNDAEAKARFDAAWAKYGAAHPGSFVEVATMVGREQDLRASMQHWNDAARADALLQFYAHFALHEDDAAIEWSIRSIDQGLVDYLPLIRSGARLERLRTHPRFGEVLAKLDASEVTH